MAQRCGPPALFQLPQPKESNLVPEFQQQERPWCDNHWGWLLAALQLLLQSRPQSVSGQNIESFLQARYNMEVWPRRNPGQSLAPGRKRWAALETKGVTQWTHWCPGHTRHTGHSPPGIIGAPGLAHSGAGWFPHLGR